MTLLLPAPCTRWLQQLLGDWTCESLARHGPSRRTPAHSRGTEQVRARWQPWVLCEGAGRHARRGGEGPHADATLATTRTNRRSVGTRAR